MTETLEKRFSGKQVVILSNNIMIIPYEPPKKSLFQDRAYHFVFPNPVSAQKVMEVYKILTQ